MIFQMGVWLYPDLIHFPERAMNNNLVMLHSARKIQISPFWLKIRIIIKQNNEQAAVTM